MQPHREQTRHREETGLVTEMNQQRRMSLLLSRSQRLALASCQCSPFPRRRSKLKLQLTYSALCALRHTVGHLPTAQPPTSDYSAFDPPPSPLAPLLPSTMSSFLRGELASLNLFEENATNDDPGVIRLGKIKTWLFVILLPAGLAAYILVMFASKNVITVSVAPTSYQHHQNLLRAHPDLKCPCSRMSYTLAEILPPWTLQQQSLRGIQDSQREMIKLALMDPVDWAAVGFQTYDAWCPRIFSTREDHVLDMMAEENVGAYWTWLCDQNECCRNLAPLPEDVPELTKSHALAGWVVHYLLGIRRDSHGYVPPLGRIPESPFMNGWCTIVLNQRRSAIQQFWETLLVSSSLLSQEALGQQLHGMWRTRYMALRTTMRTLMAIHNGGCMLPGCPEPNKQLNSALGVDQLLTPFAKCNITTLPLAVVTPALDHQVQSIRGPQFGSEPLASANASMVLDQFLLIASFGFILDWRLNASDAHLKYYSRCAAPVCTYETLATADIVVFVGVLLGVFSGGKELLKAGINVIVPLIFKKSDTYERADQKADLPPGIDGTNPPPFHGAPAVGHDSTAADASIRVHVGVMPDDVAPPWTGTVRHAESVSRSTSDSEHEESAPLVHRASRT